MNFRLGLFVTLLFVSPVNAEAALFGDDTKTTISASGASFETAFSTSQDMEPLVTKAVASAKKSIRVSARRFVSKGLATALLQASRSGKDVKIVLDKKINNNDYSAGAFLRSMNMPPHVIKDYDNLYLSFIIIDEKDIVIGNIGGLPDAEAAKKNPSSILVIHDAPELAKQYLASWQSLWDASEEMQKPAPATGSR